MQKAKRIRTRRTLDVVANDGGHDANSDADSLANDPPAVPPHPPHHPPSTPMPYTPESGPVVVLDFVLLFLVRDKNFFYFVYFSYIFIFAFAMAYVKKT